MTIFVLLMFALGVKASDEEPYIVYGNKATSERNLPLCAGPREACNVVRQRFWLPDIVHRMCKCTDRTNCPAEFTDLLDKRSIAFNARAQLKPWMGFEPTPEEIVIPRRQRLAPYTTRPPDMCRLCHTCSHAEDTPVGELEFCGKNTVAAIIGSDGTIHIHCYCSPYHFYQRHYNNESGEFYKCEPYGHCKTGEFCGYITTDSYETYHRCTCPAKHICVLKDRSKVYADEFLYKGLAYKGICIPRY